MEASRCVLAIAALLLVDFHQAHADEELPCPNLFEFYPHPTDCGKFYRCFWGSPHVFSCSEGTFWNQKLLTCDFPDKVACTPIMMATDPHQGFPSLTLDLPTFPMQDPAGSHLYNTGDRGDVLLSSSPFHNKRHQQDLAFDDSVLPGFFTHHRDFFLDKDLSKDGVITVAVRDRSRPVVAEASRDVRHEAKMAPKVRPTEPTKKAYPGFPIVSRAPAQEIKHTNSFNNVAGMVKDLTGTKKATYTQREVSFEDSFGPSRPAAKSAPSKKSYAETVKQAVKSAAKKQGFIQKTLYKVDKSVENEVFSDITAAAAAAAPEAFSAAAAGVKGDKHDGGFVQTEIFSVDKTKRSTAAAAASAAAAKEKSKHQDAKKGFVQTEVYSFNKLAPASAAASKDKRPAGADSSKQNNGKGFVQMEMYSQMKNDDLAKPSSDMGFVQAEVYSKEKTPAAAASSNGDSSSSSKKSGFTQTEMYSVNKNANKDGFSQMELFSEDKVKETTDSSVLAAEEAERGPGFVQKEVALGDALERYLPDYLYAALVHWPAAPYPKVFVTQSPWDKDLNHFKAGADFQTVMAKVSPAFRKFLEENTVAQ